LTGVGGGGVKEEWRQQSIRLKKKTTREEGEGVAGLQPTMLALRAMIASLVLGALAPPQQHGTPHFRSNSVGLGWY
jgi:hypothetical protein